MEFRYSNRLLRLAFDVIVVMLLMQPYVIIGEKYTLDGAFFWILNFMMLFTVFKITSVVVKTFPIFTKKGLCYVKNDTLVLHLGKKRYECNKSTEIKELLYIQAKQYKKVLGTDWDKLEICLKGKRIVLLAKPNEKDELSEKELYKVFLMIKELSNLVRDTETYAGDFIECYKPRIY